MPKGYIAVRYGGFRSHLSQADWQVLTSFGVTVRYQPGTILFRQGDTTKHVCVLLDGMVKVHRQESVGSSTILTFRGPGDLVGDLAAVDGQPRSATVVAMSTVIARLITAAQFQRFTVGRGSGLTAYTVERLREADDHRTELATLSTAQRLARALMRLAQRHGDARCLRIPQEELALLIGTSRNSVVAHLRVLRTAGIIRTSRRHIATDDMAELAARAAGTDHTGSAQDCAE